MAEPRVMDFNVDLWPPFETKKARRRRRLRNAAIASAAAATVGAAVGAWYVLRKRDKTEGSKPKRPARKEGKKEDASQKPGAPPHREKQPEPPLPGGVKQ